MKNIYIGFDEREEAAYAVAVRSLQQQSYGLDLNISPLRHDRLAAFGLLRRLQDRRPLDARGTAYDLISNAGQATDFAISRFLVPHLCQTGWALFVDCDVVFMADVEELFALCDPSKAVMVVQHAPLNSTGSKMDGQLQQIYARKNWSSVMLWNCDHPANKRLSLQDVNERPGRDLHAFYWLNDSEIGALPPAWNWLVNVQPRPDDVKLAHFTLGGPFTRDWKGAPHDDLWLEVARG